MTPNLNLDWTAIAGFVASGVIAILAWFVKQMHGENRATLRSINDRLEPLPVIQSDVRSLRTQVDHHSQMIPSIDKNVSLLDQRVNHLAEKTEASFREASHARERLHNLSGTVNDVQLQLATKQTCRKCGEQHEG